MVEVTGQATRWSSLQSKEFSGPRWFERPRADSLKKFKTCNFQKTNTVMNLEITFKQKIFIFFRKFSSFQLFMRI